MKPEHKTERSKSQGNSCSNRVKKVETKSKQEKNTPKKNEVSEHSNEHLSSDESNSKIIPTKADEPNFNKIFSDNFLELEEKVDFLLRIFKDHGHKLYNKDQEDQTNSSSNATVFEDAWYLFNLNKRMSAVEDGIKNLSLIIEELLKESTQRKETIIEESLGLSNEADIEDLSTTERINYLKKRNDLLTSFMKILLKLGGVESSPSKLKEIRHLKKLSKSNRDAKEEKEERYADSFQEFLQEDFQEKHLMGNQIHEIFTPKKTLPKENLDFDRFVNRPETPSEIGEPADCRFNRRAEAEKVIEEIKRKTVHKNLKGKFSQVNDLADDCDKESHNEKIKFLANETLLMSSLEEIQNNVTKCDSPKKHLGSGSSSTPSTPNPITSEEKDNNDGEGEPHFETLRYSRKSIFQNNIADQEAFKKSKNPNNPLSSIPEECPSVIKKNKFETISVHTRPLSAPITAKPPIRSSSSSRNSGTREEKPKNNSEICNNVKSKNKSLLSKKPFVRTP